MQSITSCLKVEAPSSFCKGVGDDNDPFGNRATTANNTNMMDMI